MFVIHTTLKFYEDSMTKNNLMISASVIYCHPVKCSYEISDKYLSLSMAIPFLHMLRYFRAALFLEKLLLYNFTSFQINTRVTFPEQPFLQSRCFFLRSFFFETVTFSLHFFFFFRIATFREQNIYLATTS